MAPLSELLPKNELPFGSSTAGKGISATATATATTKTDTSEFTELAGNNYMNN